MEPIHQAAWDGDVAAIDGLVEEDDKRLNARNLVELGIRGRDFRECTPLMLAAYRGQDAVVARLLALGADTGLQSGRGSFATHWTCYGKQPPSLALLLDAGASVTARSDLGRTPLMAAAACGATECMPLLLARLEDDVGEHLGMVDKNGSSAAHFACNFKQASALALLLDAGASMTARNSLGRTPLMAAARVGATDCVTLLVEKSGYALDLDAWDGHGCTALDLAGHFGQHQAVSLLLHAGADPTIRDNQGQTALQTAQAQGHQECVALFEAALAKPQRPHALFKARALLDAAHKHRQVLLGNDDDAMRAMSEQQQQTPPPRRTRAETRRRLVAAASACLKDRVQRGDPLPHVQVSEQGEQADEEQGKQEELAACVKYALGLEGGGGVVFEGQEPAVGMLPEVLLELLELLVPNWDPAQKGRPLGEGYIEVGGQEEEEEADDAVHFFT